METVYKNGNEENAEEASDSIDDKEVETPLKKKLLFPLIILIGLLLITVTFIILTNYYKGEPFPQTEQAKESVDQNPENKKDPESSNSPSLKASTNLLRKKVLVDIYYITDQQYDRIMSNVVDEGERFDNTKIESNDTKWHSWMDEVQSQDLLSRGTSLCKVDLLWCGSLFGDKAISDELERCKQEYDLSNLSEFEGGTGKCCLSLISGKERALSCVSDIDDATDGYEDNKKVLEEFLGEMNIDCSDCLKEIRVEEEFFYLRSNEKLDTTNLKEKCDPVSGYNFERKKSEEEGYCSIKVTYANDKSYYFIYPDKYISHTAGAAGINMKVITEERDEIFFVGILDKKLEENSDLTINEYEKFKYNVIPEPRPVIPDNEIINSKELISTRKYDALKVITTLDNTSKTYYFIEGNDQEVYEVRFSDSSEVTQTFIDNVLNSFDSE